MINLNIDTNQAFYYRKAILFDIVKIDSPELKKCFKVLWKIVLDDYKSNTSRVRNLKARRHACMYILSNLWKANYLTLNPWVGYSRDKNKYAKGKRLRKLRFKYEAVVQTIDSLHKLKFLLKKENVHFKEYSFSSRMRASHKLIKIFDSLNLKDLVSIVKTHKNLDQIILKDINKNPIDYKANAQIQKWRKNLTIINTKLNESRICLDMENEQFHQLIQKLNMKKKSVYLFPNFSSKTLHRVFNNSSFEQGGRFYGGWWQSIPREFRKFITINYKPTEEVDYSGHHIRILYSICNKKLQGKPYELKDPSRNTADQIQDRKEATLIMLNCLNRSKAFYTIRSEGIQNPNQVMNDILERHEPIKDQFFKGKGNDLMYKDSIIAEEVMLRMIKLGHTVLPVHDSFIVRNSASSELIPIMEKVFNKYHSNKTKVDTKTTLLQWEITKNKSIKSTHSFNLQTYYNNRTIVNTLWDIS